MTDETFAQNFEMRQAHALRIAQIVIKRFEPLRNRASKDDKGAMLLGYLRNVDAKGISNAEADFLLMNDLRDVLRDLMPMTIYLVGLNEARLAVLFHLAFVLGVEALKKMTPLWDALKKHDYESACDVMLLSDWPTKVGHDESERKRAIELLRMMRTGQARAPAVAA